MKRKIHRFILTHDDRWSFILAYVGLAVVLAIWINLFYLGLVVALHGIFEWVKQSALITDRWAKAARVLWELKFDMALVLFGLALEVYMGVILGVAGLGATARAGVQAGSRAALWQSVLRGALLSVDDAAQVARMAVMSRGSDDGAEGADGNIDILSGPILDLDEYPKPGPTAWKERLGPWAKPYPLGATLALVFGGFCVVMIGLGPTLTEHDWTTMMATLAGEMHPLPWLLEG